jgi:paraquat-inducible protein B
MGKKTNPTAVGAFVLGGVALGILALGILGGGSFGQRSERYVLFFEGSVNGLREGAPVTFRGVRVGTVKEVALKVGKGADSIAIPVYIEFEPGRISDGQGREGAFADGTSEYIEELVAQGLKAQLQMQSFVTGQLQVELDFFPDQEPRLTGMEPGHPELPTVASPLEQISQKVEEMPITEIVNQIARITSGLDSLINSQRAETAMEELTQSLEQLRGLLAQAGEELPEFMERLNRTIDNLDRLAVTAESSVEELTPATRDALGSIEGLARLEAGRPAELARKLSSLLDRAEETLDEAQGTFSALTRATEPETALGHKIHEMAGELGEAARSVRVLADYLERHPEALVHGKGRE